ncbi:MAG: glycosyltransferase, partial [Myxococcales bacterium]|nr:glycosyltransferase [Myxococcales bacterium]
DSPAVTRRPKTPPRRQVAAGGRPLRLGLVIPSFYPATGFGGPIFTSLHTAQALARRGVEVSVVTTNADVGGRLDVDTRRWHDLEPNLRVRYFADTVTDRLSVALLAGIRGALADVDVISVQALFSVPVLAGLAVAAESGRPAVLTPRGALGAWCLEQGLSPSLKRAWLRYLVGPLAGRTVWHATSPAEADEVRLQFPAARVEVVPNGIDVELFREPAALPRGEYLARFLGAADAGGDVPGPVVVSLGRLHEKKGFDILVDAFARFAAERPGALLAIAGPDHGLRPALVERVAARGLAGRAFVLDPLAGRDKVDFLAGADLFALPSHHENFGVVYAEALAAGTPVIASRDTPWQEVELHGAGRWVDATVEAVARAMGEIVAEGPAEMGARGRAWALEAFAWPRIAEQLEAIYRELAGWSPLPGTGRTP